MATPTPTEPARRRRRSLGYRHDIDGLRGLAIALVVVFHVWMGRVSGGVDVFLALSGFFFVGSLLRGAGDPTTPINPLPHLTRLARRLLPALVVTVAATLLGTVLIKPQTQWSAIFDEAVASLLYFQNWKLALTSQDYAAADATISPMQHLWSMSVQGQFYVVTLAVLLGLTALWRLVIRRGTPKWFLVAVVAAGTAGSVWWGIRGQEINQAWNYYDTGARMWELLVGGLVAVLLAGIVLPWPLRWLTTVAGLALIVSCGFVIDGALHFPGPLAWYPIGGALLIILGGNLPEDERLRPWRDPVAWLLSGRLFRRLGDIAYSLYLWHWPLLILWLSYRREAGVSLTAGLAIIGVSIVLALLTEKYVEKPLRMASRARGRSTPAARARDARLKRPIRTARERNRFAVAAALVVVAAVGCAGTITWWTVTASSRSAVPFVDALNDPEHPGARAYLEDLPVPDGITYLPSPVQVVHDLPASTLDGCISDFGSIEVELCVYGEPEAERTIAIVGGSHSEHWITGLDELGQHYGFRVVTVLKMGCPLTLDATVSDSEGELYEGCAEWTPLALAALAGLAPDYVFTTASRPVGALGPDVTPRQYIELWRALTEQGMGVLAVRDTPWLNTGHGTVRANDCLGDGGSPVECGMPRELSISAINPASLAAAGVEGVHLLDLTDGLCDPENCPVVVGNVIVYHDSHHLSGTWVRSASVELGRQLGAATGWW
ncbi:acyltransferase family protein [Dietzia sp. 179-F 9C3 NHS]|uniref:acyltransferase family protein n=1 Tax=Dietzia sp. 179-F 9C3 NHS TaxID=3374295 RepID=UPI003879BCDE